MEGWHSPAPETLSDTLARYWGYSEFRPLQGEVASAVVSGRDALVLMATGSGKSLCFQVEMAAQTNLTTRLARTFSRIRTCLIHCGINFSLAPNAAPPIAPPLGPAVWLSRPSYDLVPKPLGDVSTLPLTSGVGAGHFGPISSPIPLC